MPRSGISGLLLLLMYEHPPEGGAANVDLGLAEHPSTYVLRNIQV